MAADKLERWLRKWQAILRLQDWNIVIRRARYHEISGGGLAHANFRAVYCDAVILVRDPNDHSRDDHAWGWAGDVDEELSVVHELMHIKMALTGVNIESDDVERFTESMARVLVSLDRGA